MAEQNYISKSFILSFKVHKDNVKRIVPYTYKYKTEDKKFENSVIDSLFGNSLYFLVPPSKETMEESIPDNLQSEDNSEGKEQSASDASIEQDKTDKDKALIQDLSKNDDGWFDVRIVVHSHKDFSIGQVSFAEDVASFAQDDFFPTPKKTTEENEDNEKYLPIVHITLDDSYVDNLYSNENLPSHISRSYQVLDNSIWNKIIPYERIEKYSVGGTLGLYEAITEIDMNYQRNLYQLEIAHEYANLNARLTKEAFLSGSHASGVSPFIFHSESAIKKLIKKEFEEKDKTNHNSILDYIKKYDWRILLVDDKANKELSPIKNEKGVRKWFIIEQLLQQQFKGMKIEELRKAVDTRDDNRHHRMRSRFYAVDDNTHVISVEYAETIEEAKKALRNRKKEYDVILLDYYLDNEGNVEYGYQLLEDIYIYKTAKDTFDKCDKKRIEEILLECDKKRNEEILLEKKFSSKYGELIKYISDELERNTYEELKEQLKNDEYQIGPHEKLFFMFISAYSTAVYERLLAEGLNRSEKYWYIGEGACPTNTPELFMYHLLHLMERRLDQLGITGLSNDNILSIVQNIFKQEEDEKKEDRTRTTKVIESVRKRAYEAYHKILEYHYNYYLLKEDKGKSMLVDSFLEKQVHLEAMLEHLLQMVHLTAFGTVRQWHEIWEEYKFFSRTYNGKKEDLHQLESDIEKFIVLLKSE